MKFTSGFILVLALLIASHAYMCDAVKRSHRSTTTTAKTSQPTVKNVTSAASTSTKMVFAHFMVGIVSSYQASDWANDIALASASGIDGFALNIGADSYTESQLTLAYNAAGWKINLFALCNEWYTHICLQLRKISSCLFHLT